MITNYVIFSFFTQTAKKLPNYTQPQATDKHDDASIATRELEQTQRHMAPDCCPRISQPLLDKSEGMPAEAEAPLELEEPVGVPRKPRRAFACWRIGLVLLLQVALLVVAKASGIADDLDRETVMHLMRDSAPWSLLLFAVLFAVGELIHIPGIVFVTAAVYSYGHVLGGILAYASSLFSVSIGFWVTRIVGGSAALSQLALPASAQRLLARAESTPVRSVAVLRLVGFLAPTLNSALALTRISYADYLLGSAVGLIAPMSLVVVLIESFVSSV